MKIPLNMNQDGGSHTTREAANMALEQDILSAKKGDWNAKHGLDRTFTPLLISLAEKRAGNQIELNHYIEAGKQGLYTAARKYKRSIGPDRFRIFALDYIEAAMDRGLRGGFWSRILGK